MKKRRRSVEELILPRIRNLNAYKPIVPPGAVEADGILDDVIKLDGNENAHGCSPRVLDALRALNAHIYPDPEQRELRRSLAEYTGLDPRHILAGAGSDELISLLLRMTIGPGEHVINCPPTFGMYGTDTDIVGGRVIEVARDDQFRIDVDAVSAAMDKTTKVIFVASPNNPTGTLTSRDDILALLALGALVIVDEAYYEFCGHTVADLVPSHDHLAVLRTFSKWAGLAGLRVGYGLFSTIVAEHLMRMKSPYNVNAAGQAAAIASLKDRDDLLGKVRILVEERDRLFVMLMNLDFVEPIPSEGNFVLCRIIGRDARVIRDRLRQKGVFIRYFEDLPNMLRISVGKPEHTDAVIHELRAWEDEVA